MHLRPVRRLLLSRCLLTRPLSPYCDCVLPQCFNKQLHQENINTLFLTSKTFGLKGKSKPPGGPRDGFRFNVLRVFKDERKTKVIREGKTIKAQPD